MRTEKSPARIDCSACSIYCSSGAEPGCAPFVCLIATVGSGGLRKPFEDFTRSFVVRCMFEFPGVRHAKGGWRQRPLNRLHDIRGGLMLSKKQRFSSPTQGQEPIPADAE